MQEMVDPAVTWPSCPPARSPKVQRPPWRKTSLPPRPAGALPARHATSWKPDRQIVSDRGQFPSPVAPRLKVRNNP